MTNSTPKPRKDRAGIIRWRVNGELHRTDGPAIEYPDGSKAWYLNGERHRTDGPAIELADGHKQWHLNGKLHRTDGPAVEYTDGSTEWWVSGKLHRTDGPAVEYTDGSTEWWVSGKQISVPYSQVLNAAFARGLPIPPEVLPDMLKAMSQKQDSQKVQLDQLNILLQKHWPTDVKKILTTLFMDTNSNAKQLAFSLLGRVGLPESNPNGVLL